MLALDDSKLIWHLDRVHQWEIGTLVAPIYVEISPTNTCNQNCIFCGLDFAKGYTKLDTRILKKAIAGMSQSGIKSIMYAGEGEPLLHPDIADIVQHTNQKGIDVAIATNGSVTAVDWESLNKNCKFIRFSFNAGTPSKYKEIHQTSKVMFGVVVQNIIHAIQLRTTSKYATQLTMQYVALQENISDLHSFLHLCTEIGIDLAIIKPHSRHPQSLSQKECYYSMQDIEHIDQVVSEHRQGLNIAYRRDSFMSYMKSETITECHALPFWGYISSLGDFYTCSVNIDNEKFKVGNIYNDEMETILFGNKRQESCDAPDLSQCRINCRMASANRFLKMVKEMPEFVNFI
jgi:cyclic pyranopterin phosphate synthase